MQGCNDRVALEAAAEELRGFLEEVQVEEEEALFEVWNALMDVCSPPVFIIKPAGMKFTATLQRTLIDAAVDDST